MAKISLEGFDDLVKASNVANKASQVRDIKLINIKPNLFQSRKIFNTEEVANLASSIKSEGLLQPIIVRESSDGLYEIIAGERRFRATKILNYETIPAIIKEADDRDVAVFAIMENIQRKELNTIEEANAYLKLINEFNLTHQQVSDRVGRSRSSITNMLRLLELEDYAKEYLESGYLEMGHARALLALTGEAQIEAVNKIIDEKLNVRQTEQLVQRIKNPIVKTVTALPAQERILLESWRERLSAYTSQVKIKMDAKNKIKLTIECNSPEEAEQYIEDIERLKKPE